ncbi:MAG: alpha/beta hydrolase [Propioniciclava sp.]
MAIDPALQRFHSAGGTTGVLLCHGFTGSPAAVRPWADALVGAGHTVTVPRLPGHGTVWQELAVTSWQDWYAAAEAEYRALATQCDRVFVGGLSMGGSLALRLAEHHPALAGLILVNPAMAAVDPLARLAPVLQHLVTSTPSIGGDIKRAGVDEKSYRRTPVAGVAQLFKLWADVRSLLDLVTCPVLLYRSRVDHVVPASSADLIRRHISSADYTEVTLQDSYHVATLDNDAPRISAGTIEFIQRVSAAG